LFAVHLALNAKGQAKHGQKEKVVFHNSKDLLWAKVGKKKRINRLRQSASAVKDGSRVNLLRQSASEVKDGSRASQSIPASGRGDPSQRLINLWLKPLAGGMAEWGKQSLVFSLQCCSDKIKLQ
jgi:hypothetical protein